MANGIKSNIGTYTYFRDISSRTIFDGISVEDSNSAFSDRLEEISENAAKALETLYDDIERNKSTIQFMEKAHITGIENLANQLYGAAKVVSVSMRRSESNIKEQLKSYALPSKYSMREVEKIADEIKKGTLNRKIDEKLLESAKQYHLYRSEKSRYNKGKNGKLLGTQEHSESTAKSVFGDKFMKSSDFHWHKSYREMVQIQVVKIIDKIKYDIKSKQNTDHYIEYAERERILEIVQGLAKHCSVSLADGLEDELNRLRRLEDYDNKVIMIDKQGLDYPVDAELKWKNGKNILSITTRVFFVVPPGVTDAEAKKAEIIYEFESWRYGSPYTVFNEQEVKVEVEVNVAKLPIDAITVVLASPTGTSMSWGGVTRTFPLQSPNLLSAATRIIDWQPDTPKVMFMNNDHFDGESYGGVARHEFGHSLGLGDAYNADWIPVIYNGPGADPNNPAISEYYDPTLYSNEGGFHLAMDIGSSPKPIEIEMIILAFSTGKRQNFGKQAYYQTVSQALLEAE